MKSTTLLLLSLLLPPGPCEGETDRNQQNQELPSTGGADAASHSSPVVQSFVLPAGKSEISGLFGGNVHTGALQLHPSLGGRYVLGLAHGFGVFADGSWNQVFSFTTPYADAGAVAYTAGGGLQWTPFRLARFAPYIQGGVGWARLSGNGHIGPHSMNFATDHLGGNVGFGARVCLARNYGLLLELGAIQGHGSAWIGRFSTGLYYQFN